LHLGGVRHLLFGRCGRCRIYRAVLCGYNQVQTDGR
jgi:hypothetical protein